MATKWMTASRRQKPPSRKTIRWEVLGLQDPTVITSAQSIEEVRRQIISAASSGLSPETVARTQRKSTSRQPAAKAAVSIQTRRERIQKPMKKGSLAKGK